TIDAAIRDPRGKTIFDRLGVLAFRRHRQSQIWLVGFSVNLAQAPLDGMHATGSIRVAALTHSPGHQIAAVSVFFWNDRVSRFSFSTAQIKGRISGRARFSLSEDGSATGAVDLGAVGLQLSAKDSEVAEKLG